MKEIVLFKHNEKAYRKLVEALKNNKCATINHATGTGKTPIAIKLITDNKDKKILYLTPRYPIIEQFKNTSYKLGITPEDLDNVDTMIYLNLLDMDMDEIYKKYDIIIFDEYHRVGAKETYKKVKELKQRLEENDDGKKFVGLTATPIRFLDKMRNMTQEIFDGVVASTISLSEAMIERLLPVPMYINSKIACREQYMQTRAKVKRLAPSKEKEQLMKRLEKMDKQINNGNMDIKQMLKKYIKRQDGKFIIFCNTIQELENYYKQVDEWFEGFGNVKKYKVHSDQISDKGKSKKEKNQEELDKFNESKDGIAVLFCVDILNEGVHVDDIDGVILLRRTTSPIIYFQQIGRALSFAGRDRRILIFDLVNNFGNHNAIDLVYQEYQEEIRRLMKEHPEKREYYEEQLAKFTIMDETRGILKELREIQSQIGIEQIIKSKIEYAIEKLLQENQKKGSIDIWNNQELKKVYTWISRYAKHVDNIQFKKLTELGIILPEELSMTWEERQELLAGFNSIYEKEQKDKDLWFDEILKFITQNGRRPEINSNDEQERILAEKYVRGLIFIKNENKQTLEDVFKEKELPLDFYEKIALDKKINKEEIELLILTARVFPDSGKQLPEYLYRAVGNVIAKYNVRGINELIEILEVSDEIGQQQREKREEERHLQISNIIQFLESNIGLTQKELAETGIFEEIQKLSLVDKSYINRRYKQLKKKQYRQMIKGDDKQDMETFCRKAKTLSEKDITDYLRILDDDKEVYTSAFAIIEFMTENEGRLPDKNSEDELERKIAIKLEEFVENGNLEEGFGNVGQDVQSKWYNPKDIMHEIVLERFKQNDMKMIILQNIQFWMKNGRRPLKNSKNEDEVALAIEYEKKCISVLGQHDIHMLNKVFNSRRSLQNTCQQFIANLNATSSEEGR